MAQQTYPQYGLLDMKYQICAFPGCEETPTCSCAGCRKYFCLAHLELAPVEGNNEMALHCAECNVEPLLCVVPGCDCHGWRYCMQCGEAACIDHMLHQEISDGIFVLKCILCQNDSSRKHRPVQKKKNALTSTEQVRAELIRLAVEARDLYPLAKKTYSRNVVVYDDGGIIITLLNTFKVIVSSDNEVSLLPPGEKAKPRVATLDRLKSAIAILKRSTQAMFRFTQ